jgi:type IV pilus assembly protein PilY1
MWAFIPKNALPSLKYLADPAYCHVYTVDLTPFIFDASIGEPVAGDVSNAVRTVDHWRTILIGGMRFGGGCRKTGTCASGGNCVNTPVLDPADNTKGLGYSSYFALDITDQDNPVVLWEFSHEQLGYSTAGPALLRVSARDASSDPDPRLNGKWFVVLASGPTGPIDTDTKQFLARSDQPLRLFVLDLKTGALATPPINAPVAEGFAGSMIGTNLDTDLDYQDDVLYIPYVRKCTSTTAICNAGTWTDGGVLRLSTKEDVLPGNWAVSTLMDGIGPVTSSIAKLQNKSANLLWTFFGTGRYFFSQDGVADDAEKRRRIFGIKDPCLSSISGFFLPNCTDSAGAPINVTDVANVETNPDTNTGYHGWYIDLDADYTYGNVTPVVDPTVRAERVITDPLAATSGVVFFTTYKPYANQCSLGGTTAIWATKYNTGGDATALLRGQALIQVSTGSIEQLNLREAFKDRAAQGTDRGKNTGNRKSDELKGVPPTAQGLSIITTPPPTKKVLHVKER